MDDSEKRKLTIVKKQIEALERQRERLGRLFSVFSKHSGLLDEWTNQLIESLRIRRELGLRLVELPEGEKRVLSAALEPMSLEDFELYLNKITSSSLVGGEEALSVETMKMYLIEIDKLIVELRVFTKRMENGNKKAFINVKDLMLKRVIPVVGGIALIAVNMSSEMWPSVIAGMLSITHSLK